MAIADITKYDKGQTASELVKEVKTDLPDPARNILTHNERELIELACRLASALEKASADAPMP